MSEELEFPVEDVTPPVVEKMTTLQIWVAAITKPKAATFKKIAAQPSAGSGRAFLWLTIAFVISTIFSSLYRLLTVDRTMKMFRELLPPEVMSQVPESSIKPSFISLLCGIPVGVVVGLVTVAIFIALTQWAAKLFGGTGSFDKLIYTYAAIMVPATVINFVLLLLSAIPYVGLLFYFLLFVFTFYGTVLYILAVQAVNDFDLLKAIGAAFLPGFLIFLLVCCCFVLIMVLAGMTLENIDSLLFLPFYLI